MTDHSDQSPPRNENTLEDALARLDQATALLARSLATGVGLEDAMTFALSDVDEATAILRTVFP